jgi:hypothetical protein
MQADFSLELGRDDPALELPWNSDDPQVRYYDLRNHPELVCQIPEAIAHPELGHFLARINAAGSPLATAKCDAWSCREVAPEEEVFGGCKFVSYIDLVFVNGINRCSLEKHTAFAQGLCRLLSQAPEIPATVELVVRHCYYHQEKLVDEHEAMQKDTRPGRSVADHGMNPFQNTAVSQDGEKARAMDCPRSSAEESEAAGSLIHVDYRRAQSERDRPAKNPQLKERVRIENNVKPLLELSQQEQVRLENKVRPVQKISLKEEVRHEESVRLEKEVNLERTIELEQTVALEQEIKLEQGVRVEKRATLEEPPRGDAIDSTAGFCFTVYVSGFGDSDQTSFRRWMIGLTLLQNAVAQLSRPS